MQFSHHSITRVAISTGNVSTVFLGELNIVLLEHRKRAIVELPLDEIHLRIRQKSEHFFVTMRVGQDELGKDLGYRLSSKDQRTMGNLNILGCW